MLKSISWGDYISTLSVFLVIYYIAISYLYYRKELLSVFGIKTIEPGIFPEDYEFRTSVKPHSDEAYLPKPLMEIDISPVIHSFTDEVQAYLLEISKSKPIKEEVVYALQLISSKYPALINVDCRDELLQDVYKEANHYMPNIFQPEDFQKLLVL